jgi:septal ring factor EnvC (AmiA/AmiB activator)
MKRKKLLICAWLLVQLVPGGPTQAYVVHDPIHTVLNIMQQCIGQASQAVYHAQDIARYAEMINKQIEQINQLTTVINQNIEHLKRFGNPDSYINMLSLDDLLAEIEKTKQGLGRTIGDVRQTVNGLQAIRENGAGLYDDLSRLSDKFGQRVQLQAATFKKFGAVQTLYEDYNRELNDTNQALARLQNEKADTLQRLNAAGSLVEVQKLTAKLQAVQTSLDNLFARAHNSAVKVLVQEAANRNDEARRAEAAVEKRAQETVTETQHLLELGREAVHVIR